MNWVNGMNLVNGMNWVNEVDGVNENNLVNGVYGMNCMIVSYRCHCAMMS